MSTRLERIISLTIGATVVLGTLIVGIILSAPIIVLQDWKVQTTQNRYQLGDTITLDVSSVKLRDARGKVSRSIECNLGKDSVVSYPLNASVAKGSLGEHASTYKLKIPNNVVNLPNRCRIVIAVDYRVFLIRHITQNTVSNSFVVD